MYLRLSAFIFLHYILSTRDMQAERGAEGGGGLTIFTKKGAGSGKNVVIL